MLRRMDRRLISRAVLRSDRSAHPVRLSKKAPNRHTPPHPHPCILPTPLTHRTVPHPHSSPHSSIPPITTFPQFQYLKLIPSHSYKPFKRCTPTTTSSLSAQPFCVVLVMAGAGASIGNFQFQFIVILILIALFPFLVSGFSFLVCYA